MSPVTSTYLATIGACYDHVARFEATFPDGLDLATCDVDVTAATVVGADLDVEWAASNMLTAPAWAEYQRVRAGAWAEYDRVTAPAMAEYDRVRAPPLAEYELVTAPAWVEYQRVRAVALITAAREHGVGVQERCWSLLMTWRENLPIAISTGKVTS